MITYDDTFQDVCVSEYNFKQMQTSDLDVCATEQCLRQKTKLHNSLLSVSLENAETSLLP